MDYAIESFMDFCDEYQLAEEGTVSANMKKAWETIHGNFNKIHQFTKSLSHNVNYFKNAKLPDKMNKDIQLLLQNLTPRREYINKLFPLLRNEATKHLVLNKHLSSDPMADFNGQINMSIHDVQTAVSDAINSDAYKRMVKRDYDFNDMKDIPLNTVISQLKRLEMDATSYQNMIRKLNIDIENPKSEEDKNISIKLKKLYNALIQNIQVRCKLLLIYFKSAKASLKGTLVNTKNKNSNMKLTRDYTANKNKVTEHTVFIKKKLNDDQFEKFKEIDKKILSTGNDLNKFNEYDQAVKE